MFVFVSGSALNCEHCHVHTLKARKFFAFVLFFEKINDRQSITLGIPRFRKFESYTLSQGECPEKTDTAHCSYLSYKVFKAAQKTRLKLSK